MIHRLKPPGTKFLIRHHVASQSAVLAASLLVGTPCGAFAQAPTATATGSVVPAASPEPRRQLEEIVVTSQKRRETLRSVPSSVSVLSGAQLKSRSIQTLEDVSRATPGVSFLAGGGPGLDNIEVRGISSTSGNATVGLYLDEVPITLPNFYNGAIEPHFFDLARVEVLRGPQGTLFGASSMGGTLRFISNLPDLDRFFGTSATTLGGTVHGGFNYEEEDTANIPLVPGKVALRIGADYGRDSGYINQYNKAGQLLNAGTNGIATGVLRSSLLIKPDEDWTITPSVFYQNQRVDDSGVFYPDLGKYNQDKALKETSQITLAVGSLEINRDLQFADLTSVTGYFQQQFNRVTDGTFYNSVYLGSLIDADPPGGIAGQGYRIGALPGPEYTRDTTGQFSQEIRLTSKTPQQSGLPFSWIGGLFVSSQTIHVNDDAYVLGLDRTFQQIYGIPTQDSAVFSGATFPGDSVALADQHKHDTQFAAFGQVTYLPLSVVKLSAGLRYTYAIETSELDTSGYFAGGPQPAYDTRATFYALTPKFSASVDVADNATVYANAAKGFRVGGGAPFIPESICGGDLAGLGLSAPPGSYGSDRLWSYETGLKGRFFGNRLSANADLYLIDWTNIQQTLALPTCGYSITTNVGDAQSYGAELEARGQLTDDLALRVAYGTVHATLTSVATKFGPQAGQSILNSPNWNASFGVEYRHSLGDRMDVFADVEDNWTGQAHGSYTRTDPDYLRPDYTVVNLTAGMDIGRYEVSLFAKNLGDNAQIIQHPSILFLNEGYTLRPLTVGARVLVKF